MVTVKLEPDLNVFIYTSTGVHWEYKSTAAAGEQLTPHNPPGQVSDTALSVSVSSSPSVAILPPAAAAAYCPLAPVPSPERGGREMVEAWRERKQPGSNFNIRMVSAFRLL